MNKNDLKAVKLALEIYSIRYKKIFRKPVPTGTRKLMEKEYKLGVLGKDQRKFVYRLNSRGKLDYFIFSMVKRVDEFQETLLLFPKVYCVRGSALRKEFYGEIYRQFNAAKTNHKIKKFGVWNFYDDDLSHRYFSKRGKLDSKKNVANPKESLKYLYKTKLPELEIRFLKKSEIVEVAKMDLAAIKSDPSCRLYGHIKKDTYKEFKKFYTRMYKGKNCLVALIDKRTVGAIGISEVKGQEVAQIMTIWVKSSYKGKGVSKALYKEGLERLVKPQTSHYIGHSSTKRVLKLAKKMKRVEFSRFYIIG